MQSGSQDALHEAIEYGIEEQVRWEAKLRNMWQSKSSRPLCPSDDVAMHCGNVWNYAGKLSEHLRSKSAPHLFVVLMDLQWLSYTWVTCTFLNF